MILLHASGTQSATVTTEHSLATAVVEGKFIFEIDMNAMVAGDILEIRCYKIILTGGTKRLMFYRQFCGAQPAHALIFVSDEFANDLADANSLEWSIKQTFGTSRSFPWKVLREKNLAAVTDGRTVVVDAAGLVDANMVKAGPTGSGTAQTAGDIIGDTNDIQARLPAALGANGNLKADVRDLLGTAWLAPGTAGTPDVNVKLISSDATAADNAEAFFDGTGYAGTNNVIPTVTTTTTATNVTTVNGLAAGVITAASIATGAIDADALATDAVEEIRNAITGGAYDLDTDANGRIRIVDGTGAGEINTNSGAIALVDLVTLVTTTTTLTNDPTGVGTLLTRLGTPSNLGGGATVAANLSDIESQTDDIGTAGAGLSAIPWNTAWDTEVESEVSDALTAFGVSTLTASGIRTAVGLATANLDTQLAAIVADTNELQTDWTNGGRLDLIIDAILDDTGTSGVAVNAAGLATDAVNEIRNAITGGAYALSTDASGMVRIVDGTGTGDINTASGAIVQVDQLGTQAKAEVNAEVVDVMAVDTHAQPGQDTPAATTTYSLMLRRIYKQMRNLKEQTATAFKLYNDDGVTVDQKCAVADDGTTFSFAEMVTGP